MNEDKQKLLKFYAERYNEAKRFRLVNPFVSLHIDDLEFLLSLINNQDTEIGLLRSNIQMRSWKQLHDVANKVSLDAKIYALEKQAEKYERTIEQLRNENKILIRSIDILTGSKPYFAAEREAIATKEEEK